MDNLTLGHSSFTPNDRQFTMSMYACKEDLYKDKSEYLSKRLTAAEDTLNKIQAVIDGTFIASAAKCSHCIDIELIKGNIRKILYTYNTNAQ